MKIRKKNTIILIVSVLIIAGITPILSLLFSYAFKSCLSKDVDLKIYPGDNRDSLVMRLSDAIDSSKFILLYDTYFDSSIRVGFYSLKAGITQKQLLRILSKGWQTPINVTFNNVNSFESLAGKVSKYFLADSTSFLNYFKDSATYASFGLSKEMFPVLFLPDTYQMYWTDSPEKFVSRMATEYNQYWTAERLKKAEDLSLSSKQVSIIASIVDMETTDAADKTKVAGVYINRLRIGMPLQACPTVKFAIGNPSLKRILTKHLEIDSPYNTYKYAGLPPGPISFPCKSTIDSVLNYKGHKYLYFCASPDLSGKTLFSRTASEHAKNADAYHRQLNKLKIY